MGHFMWTHINPASNTRVIGKLHHLMTVKKPGRARNSEVTKLEIGYVMEMR